MERMERLMEIIEEIKKSAKSDYVKFEILLEHTIKDFHGTLMVHYINTTKRCMNNEHVLYVIKPICKYSGVQVIEIKRWAHSFEKDPYLKEMLSKKRILVGYFTPASGIWGDHFRDEDEIVEIPQ